MATWSLSFFYEKTELVEETCFLIKKKSAASYGCSKTILLSQDLLQKLDFFCNIKGKKLCICGFSAFMFSAGTRSGH